MNSRQAFLTLPLLILVSCNAPAWPEQDGKAAMLAAGYEAETVNAVLRGDPLDHQALQQLVTSKDENVLFLLGRHPQLPPETLRRLASSKDDFVRSGVARNPNLPPDVQKQLFADPSHTVWTGLAANPSLTAATLLALQEQKGMDWSWFAMNPACPAKVEARIRKAGDQKAIKWLKRTRDGLRGWPIERPRDGD